LKSSTNSCYRKKYRSFSRWPASFGRARDSPPRSHGDRVGGGALGGMNRDDAGEDATTLRACGGCGGSTPAPPRKRRGGERAPHPSFTYTVWVLADFGPQEPAGTDQPASTSLSNGLMTTAARAIIWHWRACHRNPVAETGGSKWMGDGGGSPARRAAQRVCTSEARKTGDDTPAGGAPLGALHPSAREGRSPLGRTRP
jgi:hypothetical protein